MFDTPILFIIFNRPDTTQIVFNKIRQVKPRKLFISADGPRPNKIGEMEICYQTRDLVMKAIDWDCEVKTLFRKENMGCGLAVSEAITWFFQNVDCGIILEDDCLPNESFFVFCSAMLKKYYNQENIWHISGTWYLKEETSSHILSRHPFIWGWATWKRAWNKYDLKLHGDSIEKIEEVIYSNLKSSYQTKLWVNNFQTLIKRGWGFTWDFQWIYTIWKHKGLTISPTRNLISNIGFENNATHTVVKNHYLSNFPTTEYKDFDSENVGLLSEKREGLIFNYYFNSGNKNKLNFKRIWKSFRKIIIPEKLKKWTRIKVYDFIKLFVPEISILKKELSWNLISKRERNLIKGRNVITYSPYQIINTSIGDYTYIAQNSYISYTSIGKFCSIGPNFLCGWGIHPIDTISTSPMFYSTQKQNGITLSRGDKIVERKFIRIGNDVFIGANVTVIDGVTISDGAIIGAGAIVTKDIPPYAIAVGSPITVIKYRFSKDQIENLIKIKWWNFNDLDLQKVEEMLFDVDNFIEKYSNA